MKKVLLFLQFLLCFPGQGFSQIAESTSIHIQKIPPEGLLLDKGWKFKEGDNPDWVNPTYNDHQWQPINPTKDIKDLPPLWKSNIVWFRLRFTVDSSIQKEALIARIDQTGASEIFLNGKLIRQFGKLSYKPAEVLAATPLWNEFINLQPSNTKEQVLAVRFAIQKGLPYVVFVGRPNHAFSLRIMNASTASHYLQSNINYYLDYLRAGLFLILAILHFALFRFYRLQKANLFFFIYALLMAISSLLISLVYTHIHLAVWKTCILILVFCAATIGSLFFLTAIYIIFEHRRGIIFWLLIGLCLLGLVMPFFNYQTGFDFGFVYTNILFHLEAVRITFIGKRDRKRGASIVIVGAISYVFFILLTHLIIFFNVLPAGPYLLYGHLAYNFSALSLPAAISVYLALEASFNSRSLKEKLIEVQLLSEKTIAQEQEKQKLLATQNETLEKQVNQRTIELQNSLQELKQTQSQLIQKEKMASLGELTAGIAHEIQNPLNFVNNFSEVNKELVSELREEIRKGNTVEVNDILSNIEENEQKINQHGKRADSIVKGMLQHSRASSGEKQLTDVNALAEEYLRLSYHGLRAKDKEFNVNLITDFENNIEKVEVVPQELGRVLLNLFNNAFYATQQKKAQLNGQYQPEVKVSTSQHDGQIEIKVYDNGNGIPENIRQKIFQPFFTTKPTGQGTGLGLSLSYDIITKGHNGELKVETNEGEFTEFVIQLPK